MNSARDVPAVYHPRRKLAIAVAGGENDSIDRGVFRRRPFRRCLGSKRLIVGLCVVIPADSVIFAGYVWSSKNWSPGRCFSATAGTGVRQMEYLNRGIVAVYQGSGNDYISWRMLGTNPSDIAFNLYRQLDAGAAVSSTASPSRKRRIFAISASAIRKAALTSCGR